MVADWKTFQVKPDLKNDTWNVALQYFLHPQRKKKTDICLYGRMLRLTWTERVSNEEVVRKMKIIRSPLQNLKETAEFFGHLMRKMDFDIQMTYRKQKR